MYSCDSNYQILIIYCETPIKTYVPLIACHAGKGTVVFLPTHRKLPGERREMSKTLLTCLFLTVYLMYRHVFAKRIFLQKPESLHHAFTLKTNNQSSSIQIDSRNSFHQSYTLSDFQTVLFDFSRQKTVVHVSWQLHVSLEYMYLTSTVARKSTISRKQMILSAANYNVIC